MFAITHRKAEPPQYVVLRWAGFGSWQVVHESDTGVTHDVAETIVGYHVNIKGEHPQKFLIVEVPKVLK